MSSGVSSDTVLAVKTMNDVELGTMDKEILPNNEESIVDICVVDSMETNNIHQTIAKIRGYDITLDNVSYTVKVKDDESSKLFRPKYNYNSLLNGITTSFSAGKMTAIMGASGAGKSTLLDVIAGRKTAGVLQGNILFDGQPQALISNFKKISGYVEQQDIVMSTLTVYESLYFAAELRLSKKEFTSKMKKERINAIITELGLGKCKDTIIGGRLQRGISGGELKRLSIGMELVVLPPVLFLDEPSSGLDSATTVDVINVLRKLARNGHTVISTIHQPSAEAFAMFDQLLLLSQGKVCFSGHAKNGAAYLKSLGFSPINAEEYGFNPAEFLLSVTGGGTGVGNPTVEGPLEVDFGEKWENSYLNSERKESVMRKIDSIKTDFNNKNELIEHEIVVANPFYHIFFTLVRRMFLSARRDANFLRMRVGKNVVVSLILVSIYYDVNNTSTIPNINSLALTFMVVTLWGMNGIGYVSQMISDRDVFYKERSSGYYSVLPYFLSKIILEWPYALVTTLFFSVVIYFGCGYYHLQDDAGHFLFFWLIIFLLNEVAAAFAGFISAICPTIEVAIAVAPMLMILQFLFAGFLITVSKIPVYWRYTARYISFFTYSFSALAQNNFEGTEQEQMLETYELVELTKWENLAILVFIIWCWRIFGYLACRFIKHYTR